MNILQKTVLSCFLAIFLIVSVAGLMYFDVIDLAEGLLFGSVSNVIIVFAAIFFALFFIIFFILSCFYKNKKNISFRQELLFSENPDTPEAKKSGDVNTGGGLLAAAKKISIVQEEIILEDNGIPYINSGAIRDTVNTEAMNDGFSKLVESVVNGKW